jgi:hypothetical protein
MMDHPNEDEFASRIVEPLRAPERVDATFEARAMSAVHAAAREEAVRNAARPWWIRSQTVRVTPLATLALAAGFAAIVFATPSLLKLRSQTSPVAARVDTVHVVRFVLVDPDARRVALVGNFNQWQKNATLMHATGTAGVWTVDVSLRNGRHEYAFIVYDKDGEHWLADPFADQVKDDFGTESSVISVGTADATEKATTAS